MAVAITFGSHGEANPVANVATIAGLSANAEASDRLIAACLTDETGNNAQNIPTGVTIGGISATKRAESATSSLTRASIWVAPVPTGTTVSVVVTLNTGNVGVSCATYSITGAEEVPTDSDTAIGSGADLSITALTIPAGGAGLATFCNATSTTAVTWTGATESHDTQTTTTSAHRHSSAIVTTEGANTITADAATNNQGLAGIAFEPSAGAPDLSASAAQAFILGQTATAVLSRLAQASQPFTMGQSATATGGTVVVQTGPADDRTRRRRRDRDDFAAYLAQRQKQAREEEERKRLEALAEAERALRDAEDAKKADAKRKAVRRVLDALRRAATTEQAKLEAQAAQQAALDAIVARETDAQRAEYMAALDALNAEIEAIGAQVERMYARRREEESLVFRWWYGVA